MVFKKENAESRASRTYLVRLKVPFRDAAHVQFLETLLLFKFGDAAPGWFWRRCSGLVLETLLRVWFWRRCSGFGFGDAAPGWLWRRCSSMLIRHDLWRRCSGVLLWGMA